MYKRSEDTAKHFETLEKGIKRLNSITLASVYVDTALKLNRNKQEALEILNTLTLSELQPPSVTQSGWSEEKETLIRLKSQLN